MAKVSSVIENWSYGPALGQKCAWNNFLKEIHKSLFDTDATICQINQIYIYLMSQSIGRGNLYTYLC